MTNEIQTGVQSDRPKDRQTDGRKDKRAARQEGRSRHNGWKSSRQTSASSQRQIGSKGIRKRDIGTGKQENKGRQEEAVVREDRQTTDI